MNKPNRSKPRRLPARRLVVSYVLIIVTMSLIFSLVFYAASSKMTNDPDHSLGAGLVILNIVVLCIGIMLSYLLARITLRPIEKTLDEQDRYIADASHELRTPLASTLLSNEVALKNSGLTLLQARAIIEGNIKDMQQLRSLSDALLQESENQSSALKLTTVNIHEIVQEAIEQLVVIASAKETTIKNDTTAMWLTTDPDALRKALVILIENAIKYSPEKSMITVTGRRSQSTSAIIVTDQGAGINTDDLGNIFDRFYRTDHSRAQVAGYGLGLSIAKKLLEKIDGKMSVESTVGTGSEFTIVLPNRSDRPAQ